MDHQHVENKKIQTAIATAENVWRSSPSIVVADPEGPPSRMIGIYNPPGGRSSEIYTTVSDVRGSGLFFFASATPRQLYAVASFKCSPVSNYYIIIPTEYDASIGQSPLRPIGCLNVDESAQSFGVRKLFAIDTVAPAVSESIKATRPVVNVSDSRQTRQLNPLSSSSSSKRRGVIKQ